MPIRLLVSDKRGEIKIKAAAASEEEETINELSKILPFPRSPSFQQLEVRQV